MPWHAIPPDFQSTAINTRDFGPCNEALDVRIRSDSSLTPTLWADLLDHFLLCTHATDQAITGRATVRILSQVKADDAILIVL